MTAENELLKIGYGSSRDSDSYIAGASAASEALKTVDNESSSLILVYASVSFDLPRLLAGICDITGDDIPLIGTTTAGEICNGPQNRSVVVVMVSSPHIKVRVAVGNNVSTDWKKAFYDCVSSDSIIRYFRESGEILKSLSVDGRSAFAIMFSPGNTKNADSFAYEILNEFNEKTDGRFPLFGGCSADDWRMDQNHVFHGRHAHKDSILIAFIETGLKYGIGIDHGFFPSENVFTVGRCDGREILELNGKPAVEVIAESAGFQGNELLGKHVTLSTAMPFGIHTPLGSYSISVASFSTSRGGIRFSQPHYEGSTINMMKYNPEYLANAGRHALRRALLRGGIARPVAVIMYPCALRSRITDYDPVDEIDKLKSLVPGVPVFGYYSFGEQAMSDDGITRHNNETVAVLALSAELTPLAQIAEERSLYELLSRTQQDILTKLSLSSDIKDSFKILMDGICSLGDFDCGGAYIYSEKDQSLEMIYHHGVQESFAESSRRYEADSINMKIIQNGAPLFLDYEKFLSETIIDTEKNRIEKIKTAAIIPLRHEGKIVGSLNMGSHVHKMTREPVKRMLETIAPYAGNLLNRIIKDTIIRSGKSDLELLFNSVNDFIFIVSESGMVISANNNVVQELGYSLNELREMRAVDLHPPERRDEVGMIIQNMISGLTDMCDIPILAKDGRLIPVETRIAVGEWNGRKALYGVSRDISERLKAENLLRQQNEFKKQTGRVARVGGWEKNLVTGVDTWSDITREIHEVPPEFIPDMQSALEFYRAGESRNKITEVVSRLIEDGTPYDVELQIITHNGREKWIRTIGNAEFTDGKCVRIFGAFQDIDDRKQIELKLQESEAKYRCLVDNAAEAIVIIQDGIIKFANKITSDITGYTEKELIGSSMAGMIHSDDLQMALDQHFRPDSEKIVPITYPLRIIRKNADVKWIEVKVAMISWEGKPADLVLAEDITKRVNDDEKIRELLEDKEILLKEVHHRVKNNLNTMISIIALHSDSIQNPDVTSALNDAKSRLRSMSVLYDKLYRSENMRALSMRDYLSPLIDEIASIFPNRPKVKILKTIDDVIIGVKVISALGIIINELITNAMKHAYGDINDGTLTVQITIANNILNLDIKDNGSGIPEGILTDLNANNMQSFGLSLVVMLVKQLHGSVNCIRNQGTRFIIKFIV